MKISNKITFFIFFFLLALTANTMIGLYQLSKIGNELSDVVTQDIELTEIITSISQHQFEKQILMERVLRIAEEMVFSEISSHRRSYLIDHVSLMKKGFDELTAKSKIAISRGYDILEQGIQHAQMEQTTQELKKATQDLNHIDRAQDLYDQGIQLIYERVKTGRYQISLDDLDQMEINQNKLNHELSALLTKVQKFTKQSIAKAEDAEKQAHQIMWVSLLASMIISIVLALSIMRNIGRPLKQLIKAAQHIGEGHFDVNLDVTHKDEIGDVSQAINRMAVQLAQLNDKLAKESQKLAMNLQLTQEQKKDLEKVNAELDRFVYTVSHDIKSPLMGISWYGSYLQKNYQGQFDKKGQDCLVGICHGAQRLTDLITDLLTLTRIARIKNPYEKVNMGDIVQGIIDRIEFSIKANQVDLTVADKMPTLICDRIKLGEVFYNLINNAIKFSTKNDNVSSKVTVGWQEKEDVCEFFVKDNGIGIDPRFHNDVFQIFRRLHTEDQYNGTGAGLSIVKTIIEEHGGSIWIKSKEGEGAEFRFSIPKDLQAMKGDAEK